MTDVFLDTKRRDAKWGCSGCDIDSDHSDDSEYVTNSGGNKRREPALFSTQRLFKHPRVFAGNNQHTDGVVDVDLAKELTELTFKERERVMDELHGVAEIQEETPDFIANSLEALDRAIEVVPKHKRKAMDKALFLRPSFASDAQFKLLFLRAEYFDATNAATRMIAYFEAKRILFGDDKLTKKRITLDDLSPSDIQQTFYSQSFEYPTPGQHYVDASGRPILFCNIQNFDFGNHDAGIRGLWYVIMSMLLPEDDKEISTAASIKGICIVALIPPGSALQSSIPNVIEGCQECASLFVESFPYRFTSAHFCYNDSSMRVPIAIMQRALGKQTRVRMRVHYGTPIEVRYAMLPFGIRCPPNVARIPQPNTTVGSHVAEMNNYLECVKELERHRRLMERDYEINSGVLIYPHHPNDVLIGRGQSYKDNPGNQYYQVLVESNMEQYISAADNFEKTCVSMKVVQTIQDKGGRFLARIEGHGWKILETLIARDKTSNSFRSKITNMQKAAVKWPGEQK